MTLVLKSICCLRRSLGKVQAMIGYQLMNHISPFFGNEHFSDEIKLPEGDEIVELDLTLSASVPNNFRKGTRVSYTTFNLTSFIFGGMIYGGYHDKHVADVLGVDWKNEKILVHKDGEKKAKWYDWDDFEIV